MKNIRIVKRKKSIYWNRWHRDGGLAQVMKNIGFNIQGSDQNKNKTTAACIKAASKFKGHTKKILKMLL